MPHKRILMLYNESAQLTYSAFCDNGIQMEAAGTDALCVFYEVFFKNTQQFGQDFMGFNLCTL